MFINIPKGLSDFLIEIHENTGNEKVANEMETLPIGTRVEVIPPSMTENWTIGRRGTVVDSDAETGNMAVKLDESLPCAHTCNGLVDEGRGYYFYIEELMEINEDSEHCKEEENKDIRDEKISSNNQFYNGDTVKIINRNSIYCGMITKISHTTTDIIDSLYWTKDIYDEGFKVEELELVSRYRELESDDCKMIVSYPAVIFVIKAYGKQFKGVAKCDIEHDEFDEEVGQEIAKRRAFKKMLDYEIKVLSN